MVLLNSWWSYKTPLYNDHKPNLVVLGRFLDFFPLWMFYKQWRFAGIKICNFACFGTIIKDYWKCYWLLLILNIPMLRSGVMQVVFIDDCKSCETINQIFFNVMFSLLKTKEELVMTLIFQNKTILRRPFAWCVWWTRGIFRTQSKIYKAALVQK